MSYYNTTAQQEKEGTLSIFLNLFLFFLSFASFYYVATLRLIARDEGFYTLASELVMNGHVPYVDFFYPQMPFLPYIYGVLGSVLGGDFLDYRGISCLFSAGTALLMAIILQRLNNKFFAILGVVLFITSNFIFPWFVTAQTYASSIFFLFLAIVLLQKTERTDISYLVASLSFGLAGNIRLYFWVFPFIMLFIDKKLYRQKVFLLGLFASILASFLFALQDFYSFWFNNIGYHLLRSDMPFADSLYQKWRVSEVLLGLRESVKFESYQFPLLVYLGLIGGAIGFLKDKRIMQLSVIAFILGILNLLPTPTYVQYFSMIVPFLIILTVSFFHATFNYSKSLFVIIFLPFIFYYFNNIDEDYLKYTKTGEGVIGISNSRNAKDWSISAKKEIVSLIVKHTQPEDEIAALWPGYLVGADRRILHGLENHFGFLVADKLTPMERKKYGILSYEDLSQKISEREIQHFISWQRHLKPSIKRALRDGDYKVVASVGRTKVYSK